MTSRIRLVALRETADSLEPGEVVGEIGLSGQQTCVEIADATLRQAIEHILSQPIPFRSGDASGHTRSTFSSSLRPGDEHYVDALLERLVQPDMRLQGEVLDPD